MALFYIFNGFNGDLQLLIRGVGGISANLSCAFYQYCNDIIDIKLNVTLMS